MAGFSREEPTRFQVGNARLVTHIGDREADLYEEWATVPDRYNHVLVRVHQDRRLLGQTQSLYPYLSAQRCEGTYRTHLTSNPETKSLAARWFSQFSGRKQFC